MNASAIPTTVTPGGALAHAIDNIVERHGFSLLPAGAVETFIGAPGDAVLLFTADPARTPEVLDLLVVLPEALKAHPQRFRGAVMDAPDSAALRVRFGVGRLPAAVFFHGGRYAGAIEGMRDWDVLQRDLGVMVDIAAMRVPAPSTRQ